jgi:pilus assembly protein TadC
VIFPLGLAGFLLFQFILKPKVDVAGKKHKLERDLEYMLKDMQVQTTSGVPLFDTLVNIADGNYGECSVTADHIVKQVQSGKSIIKALDDVGMSTPSDFMRRVMWQLVSAIRSGSDVAIALRAISEDLRTLKKGKIKAYGQELNMWSLIYMMAAIILPSMGVTLLVILSSFLGGGIINETLLWYMLVGIGGFQGGFLFFMKSKRPDV